VCVRARASSKIINTTMQDHKCYLTENLEKNAV